MNNIKSYIILNRKINSHTTLFFSISIIIFITLIILCQLKYKKYYQTQGQVTKDKNNYQLVLYLDPVQLNIIKNNEYLTIENIKYKYDISHISDEYLISSDFNNYLKVTLDINLKKKDKIVNNIITVKILESNRKIFYYLKDYLLKGVKNE